MGDSLGQGLSAFNLADEYIQLPDVARALPLAREALRLFTELGETDLAERAQRMVAYLSRGGAKRS